MINSVRNCTHQLSYQTEVHGWSMKLILMSIFYVRVDRTRKVPVTVLVRALGIGTNAEINELFGEEPKILASYEKDTSTDYQSGLLELYKKIRPGEPLSVDSAQNLVTSMFFDARRYDLAKVGRYKFNKKLALKTELQERHLQKL